MSSPLRCSLRLALGALVAGLGAWAAACGGSSPSPPPIANASPGGSPASQSHEPLATIERTVCFGWCPVYKVTIYRDGAVDYDGQLHVRRRGHATGALTAQQLAALDELFLSHHYSELHDRYTDYGVTDLPSVNTSYSPPGRAPKSVQHYRGDGSAPPGLTEVEDGIDRIVDIEQWIGTRDERRTLHE